MQWARILDFLRSIKSIPKEKYKHLLLSGKEYSLSFQAAMHTYTQKNGEVAF
jgi:hypothetical protein